MKTRLIFFLSVVLISGFAYSQNHESDDFSYPLKLYEQEFYDLAAQQFIKFYNTYPQSDKVDDARYYAGLSLYKIGEYEKARAEFQSLALEFPKSNFAAEAWFFVGDCDEKLGDFQDAVKAYESLRVLYPKDTRAAPATYKAALINIEKLHDYPKAAQLLNILIERYPDSNEYLPALVKKAWVAFQLKRYDESRRLLKKAMEIQTTEPTILAEAYLIQGNLNNLLGFIDRAKSDYQTVLEKGTPLASRAALHLARIYVQEAALKKAATLLEKQIAKTKDEQLLSQLKYLLGDVYFLSGKFNLAEKNYNSVKTDNDSLRIIVQLKRALSFKKLNFISEAVTVLHKVVTDPGLENSAMFDEISSFYLDFLENHRYFQQATAFIYQKLSELTNFQQKARFTARLVKLLALKKQWVEILSIAQPFILSPEHFSQKDDILFYYALAKENMKEYDEAAYYYNKLINEFNASEFIPEAKKRRNFLQDFKLVDRDRALNQLAELFSRFLQKDGENRDNLWLDLGLVYFDDLKNYVKAEEQFQKALSANVQRVGDAHFFLGKTYLKLQELEQYSGQSGKNYLQLANEEFKKAVQNEATCTFPDESAWLLIKTSLEPDTVNVATEKRLIEALLAKYPQSRLKEEWIRTLAYNMAFDSAFAEQSKQYYKMLIENFHTSDQYPQYLLSYARLIEPTNPQDAENYLKQIIESDMFSNEAALAINDLIQLYISQARYAEAIHLYKRLQTYFYYTDLLQSVKSTMGEVYLRSGQNALAVEFYLQLVNTPFINDPILLREFHSSDLIQNIFYLAQSYEALKQTELALKYYSLYLLVEPRGSFADLAHFNAGSLFFKQGKYYLAKENFKAVSNQDPDLYSQAVLKAGDIYFLEGNYGEAVNFYRSALETMNDAPGRKPLMQKYIVALIRSGNVQQAEKLIADLKKQFPKEPNAMAQFNIEMGNYQRLHKNFDRALKYFSVVKKKYKSTDYVDDAEYYKALVLITLNKHKEALKILSEFADKFPESDRLSGVYNTLGTLYFRSEKYDAAISMFKKALERCEGCDLEANIMSNLIKVYSLTGFWDAAQAMARSYLEKFPEAPDRLDKKIIIARAYINLNQYQNAVDYLKSIKIEASAEREPEIQFYIGEALLRAGQYEEAIAEFVKIPLLSKKTKLQWEASALYYSGQCYEKLGRIDDAIRMYKEIIKRPGIDLVLKKDAEKRIKQIQ